MPGPLPPVPGVIKVAIKGAFATGTPWAITDHYRYTSPAPSNSQMTAFANAIRLSYSANMVSVIAEDIVMQEATCQDLSSPTGAFGSDSGVHYGTAGSLNLPDHTCVLVKKEGSLRYRGGHSREYWPQMGAAGANNTGNSWAAANISQFATQYQSYIDQIFANAPSGLTLLQRCIVHYEGQHPSITYPYVELVVGHTVETQMATQRRRLGRK